jgi:hypothetical protein
MAADVGSGGETFALGDIGEATVAQVAEGQVVRPVVAHNGPSSRPEGLQVVEPGEDASMGRSDLSLLRTLSVARC